MTAIRVAIIAAVARNGVIGADQAMPWRLSTDMQRFKRLTMGKPVIVGRKTFETFGKPLPGRRNIVVTRNAAYAPEGATVVANLDQALVVARQAADTAGVEEVMVLGGGEIYRQAMELADRLYITHVDAVPVGDTRFPEIGPATWLAVSAEEVPAGPRDSAATRFVVYERVAATDVG